MPDLELHKEPLLSTVHSQGHCLENMEIVYNTLTGTPSGKKQIISDTLTGTPSGKYRDCLQYTHRDTIRTIQTIYKTLTGTLSGKYRDCLQYTHRDILRKIQR